MSNVGKRWESWKGFDAAHCPSAELPSSPPAIIDMPLLIMLVEAYSPCQYLSVDDVVVANLYSITVRKFPNPYQIISCHSTVHFNNSPGAFPANGVSPDNIVRGIDGLLVIDSVMIDEHSRLTITKRIKKFLPIETGDVLAFYKDPKNDSIVLNVQREDKIVYSWLVKTKV